MEEISKLTEKNSKGEEARKEGIGGEILGEIW